ncbi:MAG: ParA family protein [Liquorilactobacillus sp.]
MKQSQEKCKVISFINMKGGVGKTTLTINIGYTLSKEYSKNVLIIDMDPQFNATQALMTKFDSIKNYSKLRDSGSTIASVLVPQTHSMITNNSINDKEPGSELPAKVIKELLPQNIRSSKFDLIPGDLSLTEFESTARGSEKLLFKFIKDNNIKEDYDYILIDTPATYSVYSQTSLFASDYYLVPIAPDIFSSLGYDLLKNALKKDLVLEDHELINLGVLFTLTSETRSKRNNIQTSFEDTEKFTHSLEENENIRSGNISNFIYDMSSTKGNIIELTKEFLIKLGENLDEK